MPDPARFWNRIAPRYARMQIPDETAYREKLARTRAHLSPQARVLEFGCGTGSTALAHTPHAGEILATDISPAMLAIARDKARNARIGNVTFAQGSLDTLDLPDAGFDMVMGHSILHLLPDRFAALAHIHRVLKPGGLFVSSTICLAERAPWLRPVAAIGAPLGLLPQVAFLTESRLTAEIESAGLQIEERYKPNEKAAVFLIARKT